MGFSAVAAIATAATVAGTAYQIDQSREAQDKQNEAAETERKMKSIENARKRRRAVAQQRIQAGEINNAAAVGNTTGSSGQLGASSALSGDFASGMSAFNTQNSLNNQRLDFLSQASSASANAQLGSTIAGIGAQFGGANLSNIGASGGQTKAATPSQNNATGSSPPGQSFARPGGYSSGVTFKRTG